jgi:hypothetical protein
MKRGQKKKFFQTLTQLGQRLSELAESRKLFAGNTNVGDGVEVELTPKGKEVLIALCAIINDNRALTGSGRVFQIHTRNEKACVSNSTLLDIFSLIDRIKDAFAKPSRRGRRLREWRHTINVHFVDDTRGSIPNIFLK